MSHSFEQQVIQLMELTDRIIESHPKSAASYRYFRHSLQEALKPVEELNAAIRKMEAEGGREASNNELVQLMMNSRDNLLKVSLLIRTDSARQAVIEGPKESVS